MDLKINEAILEELGVESMQNQIHKYKRSWRIHVWKCKKWLTSKKYNCKPERRRNIGRAQTRWEDWFPGGRKRPRGLSLIVDDENGKHQNYETDISCKPRWCRGTGKLLYEAWCGTMMVVGPQEWWGSPHRASWEYRTYLSLAQPDIPRQKHRFYFHVCCRRLVQVTWYKMAAFEQQWLWFTQ